MKKLVCFILVLAFMLSGCGILQKKTEGRISDLIKSEQNAKAESDASAAEAETMETEPAMPDSAEFVIEKEDRSPLDENGEVLVWHTYDKVVLQGDVPSYKRINESIRQDCEKFFSDNASYMDETALQDWPFDIYGSFVCTATASVTNNENGIFSIRIVQDWFMGGVYNADYYGLTYDLNTGEAVALEDLSDLPAEEFEQLLKDIAAHWLYDTYGEGLFYPPEEVLEEYQLEDLWFYVENGEIILTFPTYTFTAGAAGAAIIPTGIMI